MEIGKRRRELVGQMTEAVKGAGSLLAAIAVIASAALALAAAALLVAMRRRAVVNLTGIGTAP